MPITTAAEWKTHRGVTLSDWDAWVEAQIDVEQSRLEEFCSRSFDEATYTDELYDGDGTQSLLLRNWPATAVIAVKQVADDGTTTTIAASTYRLTTTTSTIRRLPFQREATGAYVDDWGVRQTSPSPCFDFGADNWSVTYTAGYAAGAAPDSLKHTIWRMVDTALDERGGSLEKLSDAAGSENATGRAAADIAQRYLDLMRPWRRLPT